MASSSSSSSSSSSRSWRYNFFPSFHGPDVRVTFLSHLQKQFQHNGIITFNDEGIERSQTISSELTRAIRESRISIVCQESAGQIVMTVFYKVDPSDVRKQMGEFGKAFKKTCQGKTEAKIHRWTQALTHVANIAGEHSLNWDNEANMIDKIARDVSDKLNATPSRDFDGMVGLEAHLRKIQYLLQLETDEAMTLGISGPAGIGKTTIARALYNQISRNFPLRYFMENVKGSYRNIDCDEHGSKLRLQEQLLSQILNQNGVKICNLDVIYERLRYQKVLIILDDVDSLEQLDALAKEIYRFGHGSRIIVTTKDQELLQRYGINNTYHVGFPSNEEALEIFCRYAFRRSSPHYGFEKLAIRVTELCSNLPLGLRVVGSSLRGKCEDEWEVIMNRLETSLDRDIERVLRVGYESLHEKDQDLFLHIAIFFNYKDEDYVKAMLGEDSLDVKHGLRNLVNRSLIDISTNGDIVMHKLLQQMSRQAIHRQEPWKRHILIDAHEICDVLEYDTGTRTVSGISFDTSKMSKVFVSKGAFKRMCNFQLLSVSDENDRVCIPEDLEFPPRLRLLHWEAYLRKSFPFRFYLEYLVELDMRNSQLEKLWEGPKPLTNLKKMDLSMSCHLKELPDFSNATNLERLNLDECESLVEIPSSFSNLHKLKVLSMFACTKLEVIPTRMNLASLESVNITACQRLKNFPDISRNISQLSISLTAVEQVPASIRLWSRLRVLNIIITSNGKLKALTHVPQSVRHLILSYTGVERIPYCKRSLHRLQLYLNGSRKFADSLKNDCEPMEQLICPYDTPYAQLNYTNCFKLDSKVRRAIITQSFVQGWACLPGREVPEEFEHRARGNSLTIRLMGDMPLTILKVCVVISPNQQTREFEQLLCRRMGKGNAYLPIDEISVYTIPRIQRKHLFLFHSYLFEEERFREVTSRELVFEFSTELEIVECGAQIWKDESEINNNCGYQTANGKQGFGEEEDGGNNQQDTYEFSKASEEDEVDSTVDRECESESVEAYEEMNPAKRAKR
ncbi:Toll/interleukin-1 receptor homology (TIR) domain superfamily [Arabidopsis thaliana x Arabidopsis arenosa]|uniref:Toll/interleukin-1 receptor homology (TIR) domain superfamily n=1 Tax=Arabidopsis thaliana x Arabidopsis arenosa TaxID=1240361 RepID=A0A8T2BGU4_9BRAS|nr:Toll/interleukin-1 receptor homology (TIR) domain superfamily [Arabidopsis thaliana x Arabidopsis arenosa]